MGFDARLEADGVWITHNESINPEHVVVLVQALLDELEIDEPFIFSWSYTCSQPRLDDFGEGACVVRRGKDPIWVDAREEVEKKLKAEGQNPGPATQV